MDVRDSTAVREVFTQNEIERVIHFAAQTHVDRSIQDPLSFLGANIEGTACLLESARSAWGKSKTNRFLHVSTDEVFGERRAGDPPFSESSSYGPRNPYAASKAGADHLVRAWSLTYGLPCIVTHSSNNYGAWQYPEKLIPLCVINALEKRPIPVYGKGLQVRDWLHVEDHVRALRQISDCGVVGETYVIGAGDESSNIDLVRRICDLVDSLEGRKLKSSRQLVEFVADRPGHDQAYGLDSQKIRTELNWSAHHSLQKSLEEVVSWYLSHRDWLDRVRDTDYDSYYAKQYGHKTEVS